MIEPIGTVSSGIQIKGSINFFDQKCECQFNISEDESGTWSFSLDVLMAPVSWGNDLIRVYRSKDDLANGPIAKIEFGKVGHFFMLFWLLKIVIIHILVHTQRKREGVIIVSNNPYL